MILHRPDQLRVVHLTSVHPPFDTRIFHKECRSLAAAGYDVTLLAPHTHMETIQNVRIVPVRKSHRRISRMTRTTADVYRVAMHLAADLYHFHDPELIPIGLLLHRQGYKVVYDVHEDAPRTLLSSSRAYLPSGIRPLASWLIEQLENYAAKHFSAIIGATPTIAERFQPIQPATYTVNNYPRLDEMHGFSTTPWRQRDMTVGYVGVVQKVRGLMQMVQAMELLPETPNITLRLAGRFESETSRKEAMSLRGWDRVEECGYLDRARLSHLLLSVRAGLVIILPEPRYMVAQPTKLYEYMSAGIPAIASDFPLWRKVVDRYRCGLLVNPVDPREIACAIHYLLTHPTDAEEMGIRGRAGVETEFNWDTEFGALLALYEMLLQ